MEGTTGRQRSAVRRVQQYDELRQGFAEAETTLAEFLRGIIREWNRLAVDEGHPGELWSVESMAERAWEIAVLTSSEPIVLATVTIHEGPGGNRYNTDAAPAEVIVAHAKVVPVGASAPFLTLLCRMGDRRTWTIETSPAGVSVSELLEQELVSRLGHVTLETYRVKVQA